GCYRTAPEGPFGPGWWFFLGSRSLTHSRHSVVTATRSRPRFCLFRSPSSGQGKQADRTIPPAAVIVHRSPRRCQRLSRPGGPGVWVGLCGDSLLLPRTSLCPPGG